jgi:hypothetical protein
MITHPDKIAAALKGALPGSQSHYKMLPPGRVLNPAPEDQGKVKPSSVLLLLFRDVDGLKVCLIKRPVYMKHHAGQIALPGGRHCVKLTKKLEFHTIRSGCSERFRRFMLK